MAPILTEPNSSKSFKCSKRVVKIIGRIRGFTEKELKSTTEDSNQWITVKNSQDSGCSEKSRVFFDAQSTSRNDVYKLDYCYEKNEEVGSIYSKEIKPMILDVFDGKNASIIAIGARGSGKTYTIQGSQEKPGLAVMAMTEILSKSRELGKSVSVSMYELTQDHAYDILDPKHPEVQVLEDAHGKINLKGLSQVPVNSISEFHAMYFSQSNLQKTQKIPIDQPRKHKGLMVHISSEDGKMKPKIANKINFVDLAGYEDPKKGGRDGTTLAEINRTNKSLYALLNVVNALNTNETRLPYRESKFTRILQDSLGCTSSILLLACLNSTFCQDTVSSMSLVSRSYRSIKQVLTDSTNRSRSIGKPKAAPSLKGGKTMSASLSVKKPVGHSHLHALKKASGTLKGRKLFDEEKRINFKQLKCQSEDTSAHKSKVLPDLSLVVSPFSLEEAPPEKSISENIETKEYINPEGLECESMSKTDASFQGSCNDSGISLAEKEVSPRTCPVEATPDISLDVKDVAFYEAADACDETNTFGKEDRSPPLSERIRQISNNLKSLCSSTPLGINLWEEEVAPYKTRDVLEPKTPSMELGSTRHCSPRGTFGKSSGVKHYLVQEYLKFLNSASKDELKGLKGIGEKRAAYILELREESPEPFKDLDDLQDIGLSAKQVKGMMKQVAGELFN